MVCIDLIRHNVNIKTDLVQNKFPAFSYSAIRNMYLTKPFIFMSRTTRSKGEKSYTSILVVVTSTMPNAVQKLTNGDLEIDMVIGKNYKVLFLLLMTD